MTSPGYPRRRFLCAVAQGVAVLAAGCAVVPGLSDPNVLLQEGEQLYREKRYDEAIARFREVVARDPSNWRAWLWLCRAYIVRALWGDAIEAGRQAFRLSPQGPEVLQTFLQALFGGGAQALSSGEFAASISHFSEYLKLNSGDGAAWVNVGKAYLGNKQYGDALKSLLQALGVSGVDRGEVIRTLLSGGTQAFKARDYGNAIGMLREYVKQDPRNLQAYLTLAKSYWEAGQSSGAVAAFREVLKLNPTNGEALRYLLQPK